MDFEHSERARQYAERVERFIRERILPSEAEYYAGLAHSSDFRQWRIPHVMEKLKAEAKAQGLWNLFLPDPARGAGLDNRDYAAIAELTGRSFMAPEVFNCSAPDTGNAEVLLHYGSDEQKQRWLDPLLAGEIRSGFAMTEPDVASSDATNMQARAEIHGDEVVLNGRKWWTTGAGHPRCKFLIFMGLTDPNADRHSRHSMVLVPIDSQGVRIERMLPVFGHLDEPHGHAEVAFEDVHLPKSAVILGPGRGFEIAQGRLGPGRIHHCMRSIGVAERALELMCQRLTSRVAFGKPISSQSVWHERIAESRCAIDQARLMVLNAAYLMDTVGNKVARKEIAMIKVIVPNMTLQVIDWAIQAHGAGGVTSDFPLAQLWAGQRTLRIADGPDEVHRNAIAKLELAKYLGKSADDVAMPVTRGG